MAVKYIYALTCSTFCLVCIGGRSSMNLMVLMGVSLVAPSHQDPKFQDSKSCDVIHWACTEFCSRCEPEFQPDT